MDDVWRQPSIIGFTAETRGPVVGEKSVASTFTGIHGGIEDIIRAVERTPVQEQVITADK